MKRPNLLPCSRTGRNRVSAGPGLAALLLALLIGVDPATSAVPGRDPNWPCQQLRVAQLTVGALWNDPPLDPYAATWSSDVAVTTLANRIARRRLPLAEAEQAVRDFARSAGREQKLALAAGVFAILNGERGQVMFGLDRFGGRQKELATTIRADMERLRTQGGNAQGVNDPEASQLSDQLGWETRVFEQRRQALSTACDVPNLIERRLGALLRAIAATLGGPAAQ
jgi:hypothetical protein